MLHAHQKTQTTKHLLTSKEVVSIKLEWYRYPFVAAEILSNSAKLADAFIEEVKHEVVSTSPSKEDSSAVPALIE